MTSPLGDFQQIKLWFAVYSIYQGYECYHAGAKYVFIFFTELGALNKCTEHVCHVQVESGSLCSFSL